MLLRFAGVRSKVYATPAPPQQSLLAALLAMHDNKPAAPAAPGDSPQTDGGPHGAQQAAAPQPCPVCLGVLQDSGITGTAEPAPAGVTAAVHAMDNNGMDWVAVASCSAADIATEVM